MEPIGIYTDQEISLDEFNSFIQGIGGELNSTNHLVKGRLSRDTCHLWIFIVNEEIEVASDEEISKITAILGTKPETCLVIEMSSVGKVEELAIEFIDKFASRWKVAVSNFDDKIFTLEEAKIYKRELFSM
jgi:hypothetical protein